MTAPKLGNMIFDIIVIIYILMLMPLIHECEQLQQHGMRTLILGIVFTPIVGFITLYLVKREINLSAKENR